MSNPGFLLETGLAQKEEYFSEFVHDQCPSQRRRNFGVNLIMHSYRSKAWKAYRSEVFRLDDFACTVCGRTAVNGAVLQVHHKRYLPGHKPWEYPYELCSTICKGCHAAEHGIIPPRVGWRHCGWDDLGGLDGSCELCGQEIRYVFAVHHPKWGTMEVGEICCDHLTDTTLASNLMESQRRYLSRRRTFVSSSRWNECSHAHHSIKHKRYVIEVLWTMKAGAYQLQIDGRCGKLKFRDMLDAKIKAFDLVESGDLAKYVESQRDKSRGR